MDEPTGEAIFSNYVPAYAFEQAEASLAELSGYRMEAPSNLKTYVTKMVEKAWDTPLNALSCEQVRMLVGQKFGLNWLAIAVAHFVRDHPAVGINYYPGDLTMSALRAFAQIEQSDGAAARILREADYSWMAVYYTFDKDLLVKANELVARARQ